MAVGCVRRSRRWRLTSMRCMPICRCRTTTGRRCPPAPCPASLVTPRISGICSMSSPGREPRPCLMNRLISRSHRRFSPRRRAPIFRMQSEDGNLSNNAVVGCLLEESNLGLSKLVEEIYNKLKGTEGVSVASVQSSVLLIGQRMMYGQSSPDADVLEDESDAALWCWEQLYQF